MSPETSNRQVDVTKAGSLVDAISIGWLDTAGIWSTQLDITISTTLEGVEDLGQQIGVTLKIEGYDVIAVDPPGDGEQNSNLFVTHYEPDEIGAVVAHLIGRGITRKQIQAAFTYAAHDES